MMRCGEVCSRVTEKEGGGMNLTGSQLRGSLSHCAGSDCWVL